jgi:hypothetical protein
VQQLVNPLERVDDVELGLEDPLDVRRTQRADAIGRQRPGIQACAELRVAIFGQPRRLAGVSALLQPVDASTVVPGHPRLPRPAGHAQRRGDLRRGLAFAGQHHRLQADPHAGLFLRLGQLLQFFDRMMSLDVHRRDPP